MRDRLLFVIGCLLVLAPAFGEAQTSSPGLFPRVERVVNGQLGGSINNAGLQQTLDVSWIRPLSPSTRPIVKDARLAAGVATALTPAQGRIGAWFEVVPLSFLELRVGFDRSAYFGTFNSLQSFDSYGDRFDREARNARGGSTSGTSARLYFSPTLKMKFGPVVVASTTTLEGWRSSASGPYFYEPTRDTLLASGGDGLLTVSSVILYQRELASGTMSVGMMHQGVEAPTPENNVDKYGAIAIREFRGRRFHLPNARLTAVIARYAADPWKKGQWTAAGGVGFSLR